MPSLVNPNPEYDAFTAEWQKSNPITFPGWDAPYKRPALDTDVYNGMAFGDWKAKLADYIGRQSAAWQSQINPAPQGQALAPIMAPVPDANNPYAGITPPASAGAPQIAPPTTPTTLTGSTQPGAAAENPALKMLSDNWASLWQ